MKSMLKVVAWTAVIAGVVAIPFLVKRRTDASKRNLINIRYDINDYISETGL